MQETTFNQQEYKVTSKGAEDASENNGQVYDMLIIHIKYGQLENSLR